MKIHLHALPRVALGFSSVGRNREQLNKVPLRCVCYRCGCYISNHRHAACNHYVKAMEEKYCFLNCWRLSPFIVNIWPYFLQWFMNVFFLDSLRVLLLVDSANFSILSHAFLSLKAIMDTQADDLFDATVL